jgi:uncharacterized protein (UPF0332 family)
MPTAAPPFLLKAQEALKAAKLLLDHSLPNSATNRAYYAVYQSARAALVAAGISSATHPWSHEGIQANFSLLTRRRKIYPAHMLTDLAWVRSAREMADYKQEMVSSRLARDAVNRAARFVALVETELCK